MFIFLFYFQGVVWALEKPLTIFAASSLSNVLEEIVLEYKSTRKIIFNFDASSKLAQQIVAGAPADLYFSADSEWMDFLAQKKLIEIESRKNILSNKLVLIVPADLQKIPEFPWALLNDDFHHIALASQSVPAGKYGHLALKSLGILTPSLQKKIVNAANVRVALSWVASHEASAGIVYSTDAKLSSRVKVVYEFKSESHPAIIYPVAMIKKSGEKNELKKFMEFCQSNKAKEIFAKAGFINL